MSVERRLRPATSITCYTTSGSSATPAPPFTTEPTGGVAESSETANLRASSFWVQKGMSTLFDWMTDPHNWARMQKKNLVSGQKQTDLLQEICLLVNNRHGTSWSVQQVKSKLAYIKKKYREAATLNLTGEEASVRQKQEEICPIFARLHIILGGSLLVNPLPPRQSGKGRVEVSDESSDESSDLEIQDDISDSTANADVAASDRYSAVHAYKRRKVGHGAAKDVAALATKWHAQGDRQLEAFHSYNNEMRAREEAIVQRENEMRAREGAIVQREYEWAERMLCLAGEARAQLTKELAAERAEFRREMSEERSRIRQEMSEERRRLRQEMEEEHTRKGQRMDVEQAQQKQELEEERAQIKQWREEFTKEKDSYFAKLFALRAEAGVAKNDGVGFEFHSSKVGKVSVNFIPIEPKEKD